MSAQARKWVSALENISRSERAILDYIANASKRGGYVILSHKAIASGTGYGLRTVQRCMANLVDLGHVVTEMRFRKNGYKTSSKIHLSMGRFPDKIQCDHPPKCSVGPPAKMAAPIDINIPKNLGGTRSEKPAKIRNRVRRQKGLPGGRFWKARLDQLVQDGFDTSNIIPLAARKRK